MSEQEINQQIADLENDLQILEDTTVIEFFTKSSETFNELIAPKLTDSMKAIIMYEIAVFRFKLENKK